ncbi:hypothetical protein BH11PLA1_BH11PLA1_18560 [soil metagenome]
MVRTIALLTSVVGLAASAAHADLAFSFADPVGGRQLTNTQNNAGGAGTGQLTYDQTAILAFLVDGSTEPLPFSFTFPNARMEMSVIIGTATVAGGITSAPVLLNSFFRIYDQTTGNTIIRGDATGGAFIRFGGTSSILLSDISGFAYTFGAGLQALLQPGRVATNPQEATFTVTDISTTRVQGIPAPLVGPNGVISGFQANTSFSGNAAVVPTPGAMALLGIGGILAGRRRR